MIAEDARTFPTPVRIRIEHRAYVELAPYRASVHMAAKRVLGRGDVLSIRWLHKGRPDETPRCCAAEPVKASLKRIKQWLDDEGITSASTVVAN